MIPLPKRRNDERMIFLYYGLFVFSLRVRVVLRFLVLIARPGQRWLEGTFTIRCGRVSG